MVFNLQVVVSKLTRNVTRDHLKEIMTYYGVVQSVEINRSGPGMMATVEFEATEMCDKAIKHMDAGESMEILRDTYKCKKNMKISSYWETIIISSRNSNILFLTSSGYS